jgi:hypothetical protein
MPGCEDGQQPGVHPFWVVPCDEDVKVMSVGLQLLGVAAAQAFGQSGVQW